MRISDWSSDVCSSDLGSNCTGAAGDDIDIRVPLGTRIFDAGTEELIGELTYEGQRVKVAQGGHRGIGNPHFKSSVNRTPYKATKVSPGDIRSEASREGKECVSTCRSRWSP